MIRSVLYQSTAKTDFPSTADQDILETAWRHNGKMGVTGYLLRARTQYFQVLEGTDDVLDDLIGMIRTDPRHSNFEILSDHTAKDRLFRNWAMGYHLATEAERDEFDGWLKDGKDFANSMISYMHLMANRREAASPMHPPLK
jgi:hypothetical protein